MSLTEKIQQYESELGEMLGITVVLTANVSIENCSIEDVFRLVAKKLYVPYNDLLKVKRGSIAEARQIAAFMANKYIPGATVTAIARFTGQDHSTIVHGIKKVSDLYSVCDETMVNKVNDCEEMILNIKNEIR